MLRYHREYDLPRPVGPPVAHPLARALAASAVAPAGRVRIVGIGSGRNLEPFLSAGLPVEVLDDDAERARAIRERYGERVPVVCAAYDGPGASDGAFGRYAAILSTHAFLHGTSATLIRALERARATLAPGGLVHATFGSRRDPRFSRGERLDAATVVERDGPEANVPHVFFDRASLEAALAGFEIVDAREESAAETAGRWAHAEDDARSIVHWFVRAVRS